MKVGGPALSVLLLTGLAAAPVPARELAAPSFDAGRALEASEAVIGSSIGDHRLTAADGRPVSFSAFRGRPLVVSPIYTSCYHVCPTTTAYLARVVGMANAVLGEDGFSVLVVGFDAANDTPERMQEFAIARGLKTPQWTFASGDEATIASLLTDIGFTYAPAAGGFDHMVQATIVDPEGRVYRQVYGQQFEAPILVDGLKRLTLGQRVAEKTLPSMLESVRLICTVFDPKSGRYRFDYSIVLSFIIGVTCLGAIAVFIWRSWRQSSPPDRPA
ncbi:MAG: SCO family protein [Steroidobacteraceae bacterium]